jgi:hypothetical protein
MVLTASPGAVQQTLAEVAQATEMRERRPTEPYASGNRPAAFLSPGWRCGSRGFAYPTVRDEDPRPWLEVRRTLRRRQRPRNSRQRLALLGPLLGALLVLLTIKAGFYTDYSDDGGDAEPGTQPRN